MKRYLAIPGALLLVTALIRSTVNFEWDNTSIWMAAVGLLIGPVGRRFDSDAALGHVKDVDQVPKLIKFGWIVLGDLLRPEIDDDI